MEQVQVVLHKHKDDNISITSADIEQHGTSFSEFYMLRMGHKNRGLLGSFSSHSYFGEFVVPVPRNYTALTK